MQKKQIANRLIQICLIFCAGIAAGCVFLNLLWKNQGAYRNDMLLVEVNFCLDNDLPAADLLKILVISFAVPYFFLLLSGLVRIGKIFAQGISFCIGVFAGANLSLLLLGFGYEEILKVLFHNLTLVFISFPAFMCGVIVACNMSTEWNLAAKQYRKKVGKYIVFMFAIFLFLLSGIVFRCYVNPVFLKILQKF